jgi:hypothetical protein
MLLLLQTDPDQLVKAELGNSDAGKLYCTIKREFMQRLALPAPISRPTPFLYDPLPHLLNPLNHRRPFTIQLVRIPLIAFFPAVFQATALVIFQHSMLPAEVAGAETAVADDSLGGLLTFFEAASDFLGWHSAAEREEEV